MAAGCIIDKNNIKESGKHENRHYGLGRISHKMADAINMTEGAELGRTARAI